MSALTARFPVTGGQAQISASTAADDVVRSGILYNGLGTIGRVSLTGATQWLSGLNITPTSQVLYVDATAGLPAGTTFVNGLPIGPTGALCISTGSVVTWQNGLPFVANGALSALIL